MRQGFGGGLHVGATWVPRWEFELRPGDLIYTGTPEGVGPVVVGDLMVGKIDGVGELHVKVI